VKAFFRSVAMLCGAIGTCVLVLGYSLFEGTVLKPLPFSRAERLLWLSGLAIPAADRLTDQRDPNSLLDHIAVFRAGETLVQVGAETRPTLVAEIRGDLFAVLAIQPSFGRSLRTDTDAEAVVSSTFWQHRVPASARYLGTTIRVAGRLESIVGVYAGPTLPAGVDVWFTRRAGAPSSLLASGVRERLDADGATHVVARLREGATAATVAAEVEAVQRQYEGTSRRQEGRSTVTVTTLNEALTSTSRPIVLAFVMALGCLGLACVGNLSLLGIVRALSRRQELSIRHACGASPRRLLRLLWQESFEVMTIGAVIGIGTAYLLLPLMQAIAPPDVFGLHQQLTPGAVLLGLGFGLIPPTIIVGLISLDRSVGAQLVMAEHTGMGRPVMSFRQGVGFVLLVLQTGMSIVLLTTALLLARSSENAVATQTGLPDQSTPIVDFVLPNQGAADSGPVLARIQEAYVATTTARHVAFTSYMPLGSTLAQIAWAPPDVAPANPFLNLAHQALVDGVYFPTLHIPILLGRGITEADVAGKRHVVVIDSISAQRIWTSSPLGHTINVDNELFEVVGTVPRGVFQAIADQLPYVQLYTPISFAKGRHFWAVLDVPSGANPSTGDVVNVLEHAAPGTAILGVTTSQSLVAHARQDFLERAQVMWLVALLAMVLTSTGVCAVMSYLALSLRTELGIRLSLGATPSKLVLREIVVLLKPTVVGVFIGFLLVAASGRLLTGALYGVKASDPLSWLIAAGVMVAIGAATTVVIYGRAALESPAHLLRMPNA
jgi:putative ABC transport system permease protein